MTRGEGGNGTKSAGTARWVANRRAKRPGSARGLIAFHPPGPVRPGNERRNDGGYVFPQTPRIYVLGFISFPRTTEQLISMPELL